MTDLPTFPRNEETSLISTVKKGEQQRHVRRICEVLRKAGVRFVGLTHPPTVTSEDARRVRGAWGSDAVALKALVLEVTPREGKPFVAMVVVPGEARFSSARVRRAFGAREARFVSAERLREVTGGVERGGVPPLGSVLWGMPLVADESIRAGTLVVFNAGDCRASIKMRREDWEEIAKPRWARVAQAEQ